MASDRINTHLPAPLAAHVARVVGPRGLCETPSEYVRALIRQDMDSSELSQIRDKIREGYQDIVAGRFFESTGDFKKDQEIFKQREAENWQ